MEKNRNHSSGDYGDWLFPSTDTAIEDDAHHLLIVDDDEIVLEMFESYLKKRVASVHTARNAEETRVVLNSCKINIVICDYDLGPDEFNGVELIRQLRKQFPGIRRAAVYSGIDTRQIGKTEEIDEIFDTSKDLYELRTLVQRPFTH